METGSIERQTFEELICRGTLLWRKSPLCNAKVMGTKFVIGYGQANAPCSNRVIKDLSAIHKLDISFSTNGRDQMEDFANQYNLLSRRQIVEPSPLNLK